MILFKAIQKAHVSSWDDYQKTSSYRDGARWNSAGMPVMYTSSNAQNAMLEIANYMPNPKTVNAVYDIVVFEFPELRLHYIEPSELPKEWHEEGHADVLKTIGDSYLSHKDFDGIVVPSATINRDIATHPINAVRRSVYANTVVNLETIGLDRIAVTGNFSPVYSSKMFTP